MPEGEVFATLARLYGQTLLLSLAFVALGSFVHRRLEAAQPTGTALGAARAYFVGIVAFLALFVPLSRALGAQSTAWLLIAGIAVLALVDASSLRTRAQRDGRALAATLAVGLGLVLLYSATNAALYLSWMLPPGAEPGLLTHFGSIHAGRYANYAIFIAAEDRVPYLAQNGGQSILASLHLLLGVDSPLAALMVWLPVSMAFLTLLIFGLFRRQAFAPLPCAAATFLVLFCNIAVSSVYIQVFDNGSPIAFIGYTDMVIAVATFIVFCLWLRARMQDETPARWRNALLPALLVLTWSWYAPQNLVVAAAAAIGALVWVGRKRGAFALRRLFAIVVVLGAAAAVGATQFGPLLPGSSREDTGVWIQQTGSGITLNPYVQYVRNPWTDAHWNEEVELEAFPGMLVKKRSIPTDAWMLEQNVWSSVRIYGFPLLGLALLGVRRRAASEPAMRTWWWLSMISFATGYVIYFALELGGMKWWLTRFLVPGTAMALSCLGFALLDSLRDRGLWRQMPVWAFALFAAAYGPFGELLLVARENLISPPFEPLAARVALLVRTQGPFVFESLRADPAVAREAGGVFRVGGEGRRQGIALATPALALRPGRHVAGFRVAFDGVPPRGRFLELDAAVAGVTIARRQLEPGDLEQRPDGLWAWLPFELPRGAGRVQVRLAVTSGEPFTVTDIRLHRR